MRTHINGLTLCVGIGLLLAGGVYSVSACAQAASVEPARPSDAPLPADALPPPSMDDPGTTTTDPEQAGRDQRKQNAAAMPPPESVPLGSSKSISAEDAPPVGQLTPTDPTPPKASLTRSANASSTASTDTHFSGEGITVDVRTMDNGDRVEEYRSGGQLTRVKVTPRKAPAYEILDSNGNGRLDEHDNNAQKTVGWTLFKWH